MDEVSKSSGLRITLSLSIAFLFHTLIGIYFAKWTINEPEETTSTLNVTLKRISSIESIFAPVGSEATVTEDSSSTPVTRPEIIDTTGLSSHSAPTPQVPIEATPTENQNNLAQTNPSLPPRIKAPTFNTIGARPTPTSTHSSGSAFEQLNHLFTQKEETENTVPQISTRTSTKITPYIRKLIQKVAQSQRFDRKYELSNLKIARSILIEIKLFANGALENVRIIKTSGDSYLDASTKRSAFLASPFPPPPIEDMKNNYTYEIEMLYSPTRKIAE